VNNFEEEMHEKSHLFFKKNSTRNIKQQQQQGQVFTINLLIITKVFNAPRVKFKKESAHNSNSQDIRFRARISNTRDDRFWRRYEASTRPKNTRSRARISNTRGDRFRRL